MDSRLGSTELTTGHGNDIPNYYSVHHFLTELNFLQLQKREKNADLRKKFADLRVIAADLHKYMSDPREKSAALRAIFADPRVKMADQKKGAKQSKFSG
jgi:hypothetical protein